MDPSQALTRIESANRYDRARLIPALDSFSIDLRSEENMLRRGSIIGGLNTIALPGRRGELTNLVYETLSGIASHHREPCRQGDDRHVAAREGDDSDAARSS
jgi:hypothetical protein